MLSIVAHFAKDRIRMVNYPLNEAVEVNVYDYDKKKRDELPHKDPDGVPCWHTVYGRERNDIVYRVSIFVRNGEIAKVHLTKNVELTVKFYKSTTAPCHDEKVWRIKE